MSKKKQSNTSNSRRNILVSLTAGGMVASSLPTSWVKPVVNSVVLPTHAASSDVAGILNVTIGGLVDVASGTNFDPAAQTGHLLDMLVQPAHASPTTQGDAIGRLCAMVIGGSVADVTLTFTNNVFSGGPGNLGEVIRLSDTAGDHFVSVVINSPSVAGGTYILQEDGGMQIDAGALSGACPTMGESVLDFPSGC